MFKRHKHRREEPFDNELTTQGDYGLELCRDDDQGVADIVFVHGLTGNRRSTWTDKRSNVFWPKDLLGTDALPPTRILSYGYDADIAHFWALASQNRIGEHAGNLVNALTQLRERTDTEGRPIIFVTHSLGGLMTEDALLYSRNSAEHYLQDVFNSVAGICFLGTPHCGSDLAKWATIASSLFNTIKTTNVSLVKTLTLNSEVLARIQREFQGMHRTLARDANTAFGITCFYEEIPVRGIGEVVPKHSATLPQYNAIGIRANHMDMVRFSSVQDPGYQAVSGEIRRWLKAIRNRRDAEKFPEVVSDLSTDGSSSQPPRPHTEQPASSINEPAYPYSYTYPDDRTQNYVSHEPTHRSEPARPYSHTYLNHQSQSYIPNEPAYHSSYTYPDNRTQNFIPNQPSYPYPRTYPHDHTQNHIPYEPAHFPPRAYPNNHTQNYLPSPQEERGRSGIYQGGNSFGESNNTPGGKMLQGNFNVGGNMTF